MDYEEIGDPDQIFDSDTLKKVMQNEAVVLACLRLRRDYLAVVKNIPNTCHLCDAVDWVCYKCPWSSHPVERDKPPCTEFTIFTKYGTHSLTLLRSSPKDSEWAKLRVSQIDHWLSFADDSVINKLRKQHRIRL